MTGENLIFLLVGFILGFLAAACISMCDDVHTYLKKKRLDKEEKKD